MAFTGKAVLALALVVAAPAGAAELKTPILAAHNAERAAVGVPALSWSDTLAAHASAWAQHLATLGKLEHSQNEDRPGEGENLWMGSAGGYSPAEMVEGWSGEKANFRPGVFPDVTRGGGWQTVGHYTQMVWRGTTEVGCATASSGGWDVLVCRYSPPGNFTGERPF